MFVPFIYTYLWSKSVEVVQSVQSFSDASVELVFLHVSVQGRDVEGRWRVPTKVRGDGDDAGRRRWRVVPGRSHVLVLQVSPLLARALSQGSDPRCRRRESRMHISFCISTSSSFKVVPKNCVFVRTKFSQNRTYHKIQHFVVLTESTWTNFS